MKKLITILFVLFTSSLFAQSQIDIDYFAGKWAVTMRGTDGTVTVNLEKGGDGLVGVIEDNNGNQVAKINRIEIGSNKITLYFNVQGQNVTANFTRKDDNHVIINSPMATFTAEGERRQ